VKEVVKETKPLIIDDDFAQEDALRSGWRHRAQAGGANCGK
jgi:hypothetical protein